MRGESSAQLPAEVYSRSQTVRLLSVSRRWLARCERTGLIEAKQSYGFDDLVLLRKLQELAGRISLPALGAALSAFRRRAPEAPHPLVQLGVYAVRRRLEVRYGGRQMDALSGQMSFAFHLANSIPIRNPHPDRADPQAAEWFNYGVSLEERPQNRDLAIAAYQRCLELDPRHANACINLGTLRFHQRQFLEAEAQYRRATIIDPSYALAFFDLGNVLDETGHLADAIAAYTRAVELAPDYADAHYNLALAHEKQGQSRRAILHWRKYLRLDAHSAWAGHARSQLKRALAREKLALVT